MRVVCGCFLALLGLTGCGDDPPGELIPLRDVSDLTRDGGLPHFRGDAPRLPRSAAPGDTLRLGRSFGDSLSFGRVAGIAVVGDHLLVTDRMMSLHVAVIDLGAGVVERRFGRHGEGPNEFRDTEWIEVESTDPPVAWLYDFQNRRLSRVRVDAEPGHEVEEVVRLDADVALESPVHTPDGIIANGLFPDYTLLRLDTDGRSRERLSAEPPFAERGVPHPAARRMLNRNFLAVDPGRSRIALAYQFHPRLDFFTIDGRRYGSVDGPRETRPSWRIADGGFVWEDDNEMAYWSVAATDRYVYALFCGCALEEERAPDVVHVFRWDGGFVGEIALDREVTAFAVSGDDERLYAAYEADAVPRVGEWLLPRHLAAGE